MVSSEFVLNNPTITIATEIIMLIISILGLFLNGLAIYITLFRHRSKNPAIYLMIYIAVVDVIFSFHDIAGQLTKWVTSYEVMLNPWFCQTTGMFFTLLIMSSTDGVGVLSLLRALSIVGDIEIRAIYWYISIGATTLINISFSIFAAFNQVMRIMPSEAYCQASFRKSTISSIFSGFMLTKFTIISLIIFYCYLRITIKIYQTASMLNFKNNNDSSYCVGDISAISYQRGAITRLLVLVFMYAICFVPELLVIVYNLATHTQRSPITDAIVATGVAFTIVVNSVFLLFYNQENREILAGMLPSWILQYSPNLEIQELNNT